MTDKQMEKLADMVTTKLILELFGDKESRKEQMNQYHLDREQEMHNLNILFPDLSDEELLIGELARLQTILMIYEGQDTEDGYLKAAQILKKLRLIQTKLNKM